LTRTPKCAYDAMDSITGCSAAWLARLPWEQEVTSSNLVTPTFLAAEGSKKRSRERSEESKKTIARSCAVSFRLSPRSVAASHGGPRTKETTVPIQKITPFLWFDRQAEEAAAFYASIFPNSRVVKVIRYGGAGPGPAGSAMTVEFELEGQSFVALNGGPHFKFTEAISFVVNCQTQEEVDEYWEKLSEGGTPVECGWLKDKFGLSWQIVPTALPKLLSDPDPEKAQRVMKAMLTMTKLDISALEQAYDES
jgi:predicted 3-demethylubiquinone-9 3-methyltransferase (glyoxalase superfamily)